ncbi:MAG TPA: cell division protein [Caulobacteraceae bacterium]|nr:cell division protein [Caulobacteraceae bacterium]
MNPFNLFDRRVRGFRIIEIGGLCVLLALALVVYLAKTHAGGERADIDRIQAQIDSEQTRVTLLRAEVARLEQPERLESLSGRYLNLQPIAASHEIGPRSLASVAHPESPTAAKAAPAAASAAPPSAAGDALAQADAAAATEAPQ